MKPNWDDLYRIAAAHEGHFTTAQAAEAGYSPQLLAKHLKSGRIRRVRRSVYRIVHYPGGEHEDLTVLWLWSGRTAVFSHETALALHDLSDVLPARIHMTLPVSRKHRRARVPRGLVLTYANLDPSEQTWVGPVPVTSVRHTLIDCARASVAPEFVRDAFEEAVARGLLARDAVPEVTEYLTVYFGPSRSPTERI